MPAVRQQLLKEAKPRDPAATAPTTAPVARPATDSLDYDLNNWPIPIALDPFAGPPNSYGWGDGHSLKPYGDVGFPFFVLIDRAGNIAATSQWKKSEFDTKLAEVLRASRP